MKKMGKEVFTKVMHHNFGQLAAGVTETTSVEFLAPENMYIIGCAFGKTENAGGGQGIFVLQRSGTYRELASYVDASEMESDDFPLFVWRNSANDVEEIPADASSFQTLPDGSYFFLEKGERIYVHVSVKNASAAGNFYFAADCILYYTKTKP